MRCLASSQSDGPATCQTVRWPSSSRCLVASRAGHLVDRDHRHRLLRSRLDGHDGHVARQVQQRLDGRLLRRDQQHAVDALLAQRLTARSTEARSSAVTLAMLTK